MKIFITVLLCALALFFLIVLFTAIILRLLIARKPEVNLAHDKIMPKTEWGAYLPQMIKGVEYFNSLQKERVVRKSRDGLNLVAYYIANAGKPESKKFALLMHGYASCGKNDFALGVEYYGELGYNLLIPDQRAHGESEGKYIGFGILERYDCKMWAEYLIERFGEDIQIVLGGISMGASTVLMASGLDLPKAVKCIYADCGFTEPLEELKYIAKDRLHFKGTPLIIGAGIITRRLAGYNIKECSTIDILKKATRPVLFIHGKADRLVPYRFSEQNYEACSGEKDILLVEGAKHGTSFFDNNEGYRTKLESFLNKYITA